MNWIKQHPLATYFILAYIITWVLVFPLVASAIGLIPVLFPPAWHAIGAIGPITAAFLIAGLTRGKLGIKTILGGLFRWRVGIS